MAEEAALSEFNYFEPAMIQSAIVGEYYRDIPPKTSIVRLQPIEFFVAGADNLYVDLNNCKLEVKVKITKPGGGDLVVADNVGPVNLLLHSMFSQVDLDLNGKTITDPNTLYPFRAYVETLFNYSPDVLKSRTLTEGWVADTGGKMNITDITGDNGGLKARAASYKLSAGATLMGKLHVDLFNTNKDLPAGIDMNLRLIPNKDAFTLLGKAADAGGPGPAYELHIQSARFFVFTKEVSSALINLHAEMLQTTNYRIPYTRVTAKHISIPQGQTSVQHDNVYMGQIPDVVVVGLVSDEHMTGSMIGNPFNFQHFGLNHIALKVNGQQVPRVALQPNFASKDYIREYMSVLEALSFDVGDRAIDLTPEQWANGYTLYAFKLTPGPATGGGGGAHAPIGTGSVRLELKFAAATAINVNIVLIASRPATLEIDKYRQIVSVE